MKPAEPTEDMNAAAFVAWSNHAHDLATKIEASTKAAPELKAWARDLLARARDEARERLH
jgi:hypothetical protein